MRNLIRHPVLLILDLALSIIYISSCKKDESKFTEDATVIYTGPLAADGCGWLIKSAATDSTYSPKNLAASFQVDGLKIHVSYDKLKTRYHCGQIANSPGITQITIKSIKKM